jgi:hypothetical protein
VTEGHNELDDLAFLKEIPDPLAGAPGAPAPAPRFSAPSATRSVTQRRRVAALGISVGWLCTHLAVYGIRSDFTRLPAQYVALQILLPALLGAGSLLLAVAPGKLGLGLAAGVVAGFALLGPLSFWLCAALLNRPYPATDNLLQSGRFWLGALVCLDITLAWAAAPLLLAALTLRRAFPSGARWRSGLVGAALGLLSGAAINLHCPNVNQGHMLLGHGIPVLVAALIGGLVVSRWARA